MRTRMKTCLGLLLSLAFWALPAAGLSQESWTANYRLEPGGRVSVTNVLGSIEVEGWDRNEVELTAVVTTMGEEAALGEVRIRVEPRSDSLEVRTLYRGQSEEPVSVDYHLRLPRQARLESLQTVNGDIVVRNVEGWVAARTLNGSIEESGIAGSVVASTVNGSIRVALRAMPGREGAVELETLNGSLDLLLPAQANADVDLSTVAGRIESGVVFEASGATSGTAVRTRLGRGGVRVRLRTVRGDIRVSEGEGVL